jgi:polygalacturonase
MTFSRLLLVDRAEHVTIAGRGTIDGAGSTLRARGAAPNLLRVRESAHVRVQDALFRNAAAWTIHLLASRDVALENAKVINDRTTLNTDGIDPDMSVDVTIDRAFVYTKDDGICVKATRNSDLFGEPRNIAVTNCLVSSLDAALKVGTESHAARFADVRFEHDHVFDSGRAISIVVRDGAVFEDVSFRHIRVGPRVDHLVEQVIGVRAPQAAFGAIRRLTFDDVKAPAYAPPASNWTWYAQFRPDRPAPDARVDVFEGADDLHAVDGLTIRDMVVNGVHLSDAAVARDVAGLTIGPHVRNVSFE